jgi:hypothetical protein
VGAKLFIIDPFIKRGAFHLICGPRNAGKTAFVMQALGLTAPPELPVDYVPRNLDIFAQDKIIPNPMGPQANAIWYVDMNHSTEDVHDRMAQLGVKVNHDDGAGGLNVVSGDEIKLWRASRHEQKEIRNAALREILEVGGILDYIEQRHQDKPEILIIDGISLTMPDAREDPVKQLRTESDWRAGLSASYLQGGGALIGLHRAKCKVDNGSDVPGTESFRHHSMTYLTYVKGGAEGHRNVIITGNTFTTRKLKLEFVSPGLFVPRLGTEPVNKESGVYQALRTMAFELSLKSDTTPRRFRSGDLYALSAGMCSSKTAERWLEEECAAGRMVRDKKGIYIMTPMLIQ